MEQITKFIVFSQFQAALTELKKQESSDQINLLTGLCFVKSFQPVEALEYLSKIKNDLVPSDQVQNYILQGIALLQTQKAQEAQSMFVNAEVIAKTQDNNEEIIA